MQRWKKTGEVKETPLRAMTWYTEACNGNYSGGVENSSDPIKRGESEHFCRG
jgi:hypothetical protein